MLIPIHADITRQALGGLFSPRALAAIIASNQKQDALSGQIGHTEFHFDDNDFEGSYAFINEQRRRIQPALEGGDAPSAWQAFGRLTHTAQDFYAHSNYVDLWLSCQPNGIVPSPSEIDPLDDTLIGNPSLRSGKQYYPFGVLSFVPGIKKLVMPLLPRDSHAWMNLDSAERGPMFEYALRAAVKRTAYEYERVTRHLTGELTKEFTDLG